VQTNKQSDTAMENDIERFMPESFGRICGVAPPSLLNYGRPL